MHIPNTSLWLYWTPHISLIKHGSGHNERRLLRCHFLRENQTWYQMWHSEQMLLLKEHWSSSLVQHNPHSFSAAYRHAEENRERPSWEKNNQRLIQSSAVNFQHDNKELSCVLLQEEPATKPKAAHSYKPKHGSGAEWQRVKPRRSG